MAVTDQHAQWLARRIRTCAQVPGGLPLSWMAEKLVRHVWRLEHRPRGRADVVDDALAVPALSTAIGAQAQRNGVRQALRVGATVPEVAMALGISIEDAQYLAQQLEERDRFRKEYVQRVPLDCRSA
ncbi:hypothetical protein [Streptomyces sp. NPDC090994]|uniref:hypothetical protein n=1 Tax=Streptomyces sp. NPDC090994 TaxID=3365969 RepID=UPI003828C086